MKNRTKCITAAFLLLVASIPFGSTIGLAILEWMVKEEMKEKLEYANLQTIEIPLKGFQWHEKGSEVLVNRKLFDVKSFHISDDKIYLTGLFDEKETELEEQISGMQKKNGDNESKEQMPAFLLSEGPPSPINILPPAVLTSSEKTENSRLLPNPFLSVPFTPPDSSLLS